MLTHTKKHTAPLHVAMKIEECHNNSRKLPSHLENQVDDFILDIFVPMRPYLWQWGVTPNMLTSASAISLIITIVAIHAGYFGWAALAYTIGYLFDVFDGNFARCYGMVSVHGDMFDHVKDVLALFGIYTVLLINHRIPFSWKMIFIVISLTLALLTSVYFGCQEIYHYKTQGRVPKGSTFMSPFRRLCQYNTMSTMSVEDKLKIMRWTGSGTWSYFFVAFLICVQFCARA